MASENAVFCIDCGTKNVHFATYCRKCGSKLQKSEENISVEVPLSTKQTNSFTNTKNVTQDTNTKNVTQNTNTKNETNPFTNNNNTSSSTNIYQEGKYLHVGIKGTSPICSKIVQVTNTMSGTLVTLENNAALMFGNDHDSNYTFINILDEPYSGSCSLKNTEWEHMDKPQKRMLIVMIFLVIIIDILYISGWILDQLNTLTDNISCGISQLYDSNSNNISYKQICNEYEDCDMLEYGRIILICTIIGFLLFNILVGFCICVNIFYDRHFMKARTHTVSVFIGCVISGVIVLFAFSLWGGRNKSNCDNGCIYYGTTCTEYKNGITQNMFITIEALSMFFGAVIPAICSSDSFIV
eukprot:157780_1